MHIFDRKSVRYIIGYPESAATLYVSSRKRASIIEVRLVLVRWTIHFSAPAPLSGEVAAAAYSTSDDLDANLVMCLFAA